jgi:hypothetical protein
MKMGEMDNIEQHKCSHVLCSKNAVTKGFCQRHYMRDKRSKEKKERPLSARCEEPGCTRKKFLDEMYCESHLRYKRNMAKTSSTLKRREVWNNKDFSEVADFFDIIGYRLKKGN